MPTIIGTDEVLSLSRRIILPYITDQVYGSNAFFFRLNSSGKKRYEGGTHIEAPFMYQELTNGGAFQGYDVVDVSPQESIKNGGWDMKEYQQPITIDRRTLIRMNSSQAVANELAVRGEQARMQLASNLGTDLSRSEGSSGTGSDLKKITGTLAVIDAGGNTTAYAGLTRSSNTYLNAQIDSSTATLTLTALRNGVSNCTFGAHSTTLIRSRSEQYNRYWSLCVTNQRFMAGQGQSDAMLAQAGFKNLSFDDIPWIVDDKVVDGANTSNSRIELLNENVFELAIFGGQDFTMEDDWRKPVNQPGAMTHFLFWNGEVLCTAPQLQGALTAVTA
jgi:hypothetical protein